MLALANFHYLHNIFKLQTGNYGQKLDKNFTALKNMEYCNIEEHLKSRLQT